MRSLEEMLAEGTEKLQEALAEIARLLQEVTELPSSRAPYTQPERIVAPTADQYQTPKRYRLDHITRSSLYHRRIMKR